MLHHRRELKDRGKDIKERRRETRQRRQILNHEIQDRENQWISTEPNYSTAIFVDDAVIFRRIVAANWDNVFFVENQGISSRTALAEIGRSSERLNQMEL
jgi:hypothetical protein